MEEASALASAPAGAADPAPATMEEASALASAVLPMVAKPSSDDAGTSAAAESADEGAEGTEGAEASAALSGSKPSTPLAATASPEALPRAAPPTDGAESAEGAAAAGDAEGAGEIAAPAAEPSPPLLSTSICHRVGPDCGSALSTMDDSATSSGNEARGLTGDPSSAKFNPPSSGESEPQIGALSPAATAAALSAFSPGTAEAAAAASASTPSGGPSRTGLCNRASDFSVGFGSGSGLRGSASVRSGLVSALPAKRGCGGLFGLQRWPTVPMWSIKVSTSGMSVGKPNHPPHDSRPPGD
mmetsp:Transcript_106801/g.341122  ORF Transcript_106801/g.341122 Transcript_106801/m.341122 type:complete len:300 (-) Transcript_106801:3156-4055(-)